MRVLLLTAAVLAGCTGGDPAAEAVAALGSVGVLHVDRVAGAGQTALSAGFARYRGLEAPAVLGLLGSASPAELESCAFVVADEALGADRAEVELLDVGTIQVRVAGSEARLSPRPFPDLASVVAGVFYAGDASLGAPVADADEYVFQAAGSLEVPAFDAIVPAPADPTDLQLDGVSIDALSSLDRTRTADLTWAAGDPRDVVEIELRSHGEVLSCAAADDGGFRLSREALATLTADPRATLLVRRVRVSPVDVTGVDEAFARIAVTRSVPVELR